MPVPWYENDRLWEVTESNIFSPERCEAAKGEIDQLETLLGSPVTGKVLDLCCGVGRHSLELARRGCSVCAVDRTEAYLERARTQAAAEKQSIEFVQCDMRQFRRENAFDLAINLFTSFGYFDDPNDDRLVAENLLHSLKPGGRVVIDLVGKEILARIYLERDWHRLEDGRAMLAERKVCRDWTWMENKWTIVGESSCEEFEFSHRIYSAAELSMLLSGVGFEAI
ncbi:MAG: class I SAM-dependent methyltransferase, partial [Candidatus Zixiibacteriota bacterium]